LIYLYHIQLYDLLFWEKINFHQALINDSVYLYEAQDNMVDETAQYFARYLFSQWDGVDVFIADAMNKVTVVHDVLKTMKDNFTAIEQIILKWNDLLITWKAKPVAKDDFERDQKVLIKSRYADIKDSGKKIHSLLKETNKILRVSNASPDWRDYIEFANNIVIDGLSTSITTSLYFLLNQLDPSSIRSEGK